MAGLQDFIKKIHEAVKDGLIDHEQAVHVIKEYHDKEQAEAQQMAGSLIPGVAQHPVVDPGHKHSIGGFKINTGSGLPNIAGKLREEDAYKVLMLRMRVPEYGTLGFKGLSICQDDDKTYVFVVSKGGPTILEDEPDMFPSDKLIAQLILLRG